MDSTKSTPKRRSRRLEAGQKDNACKDSEKTEKDDEWCEDSDVIPDSPVTQSARPVDETAATMLFQGKNPVIYLNNLYTNNVTYEYQDATLGVNDDLFTCVVKLEGQTFKGISSNKKEAKLLVARNCLLSLERQGFVEKRHSAISERRQLKSERNEHWHKLMQLERTLDWKVVQEPPPDEFGVRIRRFIYEAPSDGKTYRGEGKSRRAARFNCIENLLRGTGKWTEADERVQVHSRQQKGYIGDAYRFDEGDGADDASEGKGDSTALDKESDGVKGDGSGNSEPLGDSKDSDTCGKPGEKGARESGTPEKSEDTETSEETEASGKSAVSKTPEKKANTEATEKTESASKSMDTEKPSTSAQGSAPVLTWDQIKKKIMDAGLEADEKKNFVANVYYLFPTIEFSYDWPDIPPGMSKKNPILTAKATIGDRIFEGKGVGKKISKYVCCANIICTLYNRPLPDDLQEDEKQPGVRLYTRVIPKAKKLVNSGQSPITMVHNLHQYAIFSLDWSDTSTVPAKVQMSAVIDGKTYVAQGTNKKRAKLALCEEVLRKEYGEEAYDMMVETGALICTSGHYDHKIEYETWEGEPPTIKLTSLYHTVMFAVDRDEGTGLAHCSLEVEGKKFSAIEKNIKSAKNRAALLALQWLKENGLIEKRKKIKEKQKAERKESLKRHQSGTLENELWKKKRKEMRKGIPQNMQNDPNFVPRISTRQITEDIYEYGEPTAAEAKPQDDGSHFNAIRKLYELYPDLKYYLLSEPEEGCKGNYTYEVEVEGLPFVGRSYLRKFAKMLCAEYSLRGIGRWSVIDERIKTGLPVTPEEIEESMKVDGKYASSVAMMKNAVHKLEGLEGKLDYVWTKKPQAGEIGLYVIEVKVKGKTYTGKSMTKLAAKLSCAENALKDMGQWSDMDTLTYSILPVCHAYGAHHNRSAITKLHDLEPTVKFEEIHTPKKGAEYTAFRVHSQGMVFTEKAYTRKMAKLKCAIAALKGTDRWDADDEMNSKPFLEAYQRNEDRLATVIEKRQKDKFVKLSEQKIEDYVDSDVTPKVKNPDFFREPRTSLRVLSEIAPDLQYFTKLPPERNDLRMHVMMADYMGKRYYGCGITKKRGKYKVAEHILKENDFWTDDLEKVTKGMEAAWQKEDEEEAAWRQQEADNFYTKCMTIFSEEKEEAMEGEGEGGLENEEDYHNVGKEVEADEEGKGEGDEEEEEEDDGDWGKINDLEELEEFSAIKEYFGEDFFEQFEDFNAMKDWFEENFCKQQDGEEEGEEGYEGSGERGGYRGRGFRGRVMRGFRGRGRGGWYTHDHRDRDWDRFDSRDGRERSRGYDRYRDRDYDDHRRRDRDRDHDYRDDHRRKNWERDDYRDRDREYRGRDYDIDRDYRGKDRSRDYRERDWDRDRDYRSRDKDRDRDRDRSSRERDRYRDRYDTSRDRDRDDTSRDRDKGRRKRDKDQDHSEDDEHDVIVIDEENTKDKDEEVIILEDDDEEEENEDYGQGEDLTEEGPEDGDRRKKEEETRDEELEDDFSKQEDEEHHEGEGIEGEEYYGEDEWDDWEGDEECEGEDAGNLDFKSLGEGDFSAIKEHFGEDFFDQFEDFAAMKKWLDENFLEQGGIDVANIKKEKEDDTRREENQKDKVDAQKPKDKDTSDSKSADNHDEKGQKDKEQEAKKTTGKDAFGRDRDLRELVKVHEDRDRNKDSEGQRGRGRGYDSQRGRGRDVKYERGRGRDFDHDRNRDYDRERGRSRDFDHERGRSRDFDYDRDRDYDRERKRDYEHDCGRRDYDHERGRSRDFDHERGRGRDFDHERGRGKDFDHERGRGRDFDYERGKDRDYDHERGKGRDYERDRRDYDYERRSSREFDRERRRGGDFDRERGRSRDFDHERGRSRDYEREHGRNRDHERDRGPYGMADKDRRRDNERDRERRRDERGRSIDPEFGHAARISKEYRKEGIGMDPNRLKRHHDDRDGGSGPAAQMSKTATSQDKQANDKQSEKDHAQGYGDMEIDNDEETATEVPLACAGSDFDGAGAIWKQESDFRGVLKPEPAGAGRGDSLGIRGRGQEFLGRGRAQVPPVFDRGLDMQHGFGGFSGEEDIASALGPIIGRDLLMDQLLPKADRGRGQGYPGVDRGRGQAFRGRGHEMVGMGRAQGPAIGSGFEINEGFREQPAGGIPRGRGISAVQRGRGSHRGMGPLFPCVDSSGQFTDLASGRGVPVSESSRGRGYPGPDRGGGRSVPSLMDHGSSNETSLLEHGPGRGRGLGYSGPERGRGRGFPGSERGRGRGRGVPSLIHHQGSSDETSVLEQSQGRGQAFSGPERGRGRGFSGSERGRGRGFHGSERGGGRGVPSLMDPGSSYEPSVMEQGQGRGRGRGFPGPERGRGRGFPAPERGRGRGFPAPERGRGRGFPAPERGRGFHGSERGRGRGFPGSERGRGGGVRPLMDQGPSNRASQIDEGLSDMGGGSGTGAIEHEASAPVTFDYSHGQPEPQGDLDAALRGMLSNKVDDKWKAVESLYYGGY